MIKRTGGLIRVDKVWKWRVVKKNHYGNSAKVAGGKESSAEDVDHEIMVISIFIRLSQYSICDHREGK